MKIFSSGSPPRSLGPLLLLILAGVHPTWAQPRDPVLEKARQEARSEDIQKREKAWATLVAAGEAGKAILRPLLARCHEREIRLLMGVPRSRAGKKLRKLTEVHLAEARKEALSVIYNRNLYPDENHGIVGQPLVDEKVGKVRALYETPVETLRQEVTSLEKLLRDLELSYRFVPEVGGIPLPADHPDFKTCLQKLNRAVNTRSLGIGSTHLRRAERAREALRQVESEASPAEIQVVVLLNEYRHMMGRPPLAPHLLLMRAARKHSQEMEDLKYFSHTSPTPDLRTPSMRAAREGYGGSCAENIARAGSAEGAHNGWYNSSGHHRNMLGHHRVIGLGRSRGGGFWTQMLGSGAVPGSKKTPSKHDWVSYLKRAEAVPPHDLDSHRDLAVWCRNQGLLRAMEREAARVLAARPEDEKIRQLLGESRVNGAWMHLVNRAAREGDSVQVKIRILKPLFKNEDPYHRIRVVRALAGLFDPRAEKWVAHGLKDTHPDVRIEACLGLMVGIGKRVESKLKGRLKDRHPRVRHHAAAALYRRGNAVGIPDLLKEAVQGDEAARASAGEAIRFIAHQDFDYAWNADRAGRAAAVARALEWFKSQTDGLDIPR